MFVLCKICCTHDTHEQGPAKSSITSPSKESFNQIKHSFTVSRVHLVTSDKAGWNGIQCPARLVSFAASRPRRPGRGAPGCGHAVLGAAEGKPGHNTTQPSSLVPPANLRVTASHMPLNVPHMPSMPCNPTSFQHNEPHSTTRAPKSPTQLKLAAHLLH